MVLQNHLYREWFHFGVVSWNNPLGWSHFHEFFYGTILQRMVWKTTPYGRWFSIIGQESFTLPEFHYVMKYHYQNFVTSCYRNSIPLHYQNYVTVLEFCYIIGILFNYRNSVMLLKFCGNGVLLLYITEIHHITRYLLQLDITLKEICYIILLEFFNFILI